MAATRSVLLIFAALALIVPPAFAQVPLCQSSCTPAEANPGGPTTEPPIDMFIYVDNGRGRNDTTDDLGLQVWPPSIESSVRITESRDTQQTNATICATVSVPGVHGLAGLGKGGELLHAFMEPVRLGARDGTLYLYAKPGTTGDLPPPDSIRVTATVELRAVTPDGSDGIGEGQIAPVLYERASERWSYRELKIPMISEVDQWPGSEDMDNGIRLVITLCRPTTDSVAGVHYDLLIAPLAPPRLIWPVMNPGAVDAFQMDDALDCVRWSYSSPFGRANWNFMNASIAREEDNGPHSLATRPPDWGIIMGDAAWDRTHGIKLSLEDPPFVPGSYVISMENTQGTFVLQHGFDVPPDAQSVANVAATPFTALLFVLMMFWRRWSSRDEPSR